MKRFDLLGNRPIKAAAAAGDLGTAVIFDGPFGSGKKAAAAYAAAALLCRAKNGRPCGVCPACVQAAAGSHPDIFLFNPEGGNILIDQVRELRRQSFIAPNQSPFKVFIINRADRMNPPAQNALLKVLEEPTSSVFILLTENAGALLQTVRSRCRIYAMEPLAPDVIAEWLSSHPVPGQKAPTAGALREAAGRADGSIGRAMQLLENGLSRPARLAEEFVASLRGSALQIMEACLAASALPRNEYGDFYTECTALLAADALAYPADAGYYIAVYEYMQQQRDKLLENNGSVFALSSQLAAFCGTIYRRT